MLSYTVYSEAGGVGKTTLAYNLAVAHKRAGLDVLVVPLDPQDGSFSHLAGVDGDRDRDDVDTLIHHLVEREKGEFGDLIKQTAEGVDVVPEHNFLTDLDEHIATAAESRERLGESYPKYTQLLRVLRENDVHERYDVLIVDPPATAGMHLYNAISATRNLVLPVEPSGKGQASIRGLEQLVDGLSDELGIEIGVLAAVPNRVKGTRDQGDIVAEVEAMGFDVPVVLGDRTSLFEGCWREQCSAYTYVRDHRDRRRDYEVETLAQLDELARHIERVGDIKSPSPPTPGAVETPAEVEP